MRKARRPNLEPDDRAATPYLSIIDCFLSRQTRLNLTGLREQSLWSAAPGVLPAEYGASVVGSRVPGRLFFWRELLLAGAADGANPIPREIFERRSGGDVAFRIADRGVVHIATDVTHVFLHLISTPYMLISPADQVPSLN
ncbi:MAG: hypothetical protein AMJ41_03320 [candidate division Zixibacteria bacterium DG_27]|nr:MAG: hypothetical protein AMJ41_03320 [candidate division Zixibacteria bacterium DG_27]